MPNATAISSYVAAPRAHSRRIRIVVVSEPGFAGVKRHVVDTLDHIDVEDFDITYIYSLGRADATYRAEIERISRRGIQCVEVPMSRNISPIDDVKSYFRIRQLLCEISPDIVHCHSAKAGFLGRFAARSLRGRGAVTVYTPHAMPCFLSKNYHRLERLAGYWTDLIVAVSPSEKVDIERWKIVAPSRIEVIPLHVSCDNACDPCPTPEAFTVGACGRISRQKNAALFFEAGIQVLEQYPSARLLWIGDYSNDAESQKVRAIIAACPHADRITVTGWSSTPNELLATLDVFCMFSIYESFGYATADAMTIGIPVVATLATGTRDLVKDGFTGLITEDDPACAAGQILRLAKSSELGGRLVRNAREYIRETYSRSNTLSGVEALYRRCAPHVHETHARDDRCST